MAIVFIPAQLRDLTNGVSECELPGSSVRELIRALDERFPGSSARLCQGNQLAPGLAVSVDGEMPALGCSAPVGTNSEVHFLPALGGG